MVPPSSLADGIRIAITPVGVESAKRPCIFSCLHSLPADHRKTLITHTVCSPSSSQHRQQTACSQIQGDRTATTTKNILVHQSGLAARVQPADLAPRIQFFILCVTLLASACCSRSRFRCFQRQSNLSQLFLGFNLGCIHTGGPQKHRQVENH